MITHAGKFPTLSQVIGADEEKTKCLLLEIGARASEYGQALWTLKLSTAPHSYRTPNAVNTGCC